jgi:hypothetical protein
MSNARIEILKLVAQGKISPEDAERILGEMDPSPGVDSAQPEGPRSTARMGETLSHVLEQVSESVRGAVDDAVTSAQRVFEEHRTGTEGIDTTAGGFALPSGSRLKVQQAVRVSFGGTSRGANVIIRVAQDDRARIVRGEAAEVHKSGNDYVLTWAKGNLELEIPRSLSALEVRSLGGDLEIQGYAGPMAVETMGGEVRILGARASFRARTMGGRVRMADLDLREGLSSISTTGGDVLVELTKEASVTVRAGTLGGSIEFPPGSDRETGVARRRATAVIGEGKAELKIDSLGGNVLVKVA